MENSNVFIEGIEVTIDHMGAPVLYLPLHATDEDHPDCEIGFISTVKDGALWARFHDRDTGTKCNPETLRWL